MDVWLGPPTCVLFRLSIPIAEPYSPVIPGAGVGVGAGVTVGSGVGIPDGAGVGVDPPAGVPLVTGTGVGRAVWVGPAVGSCVGPLVAIWVAPVVGTCVGPLVAIPNEAGGVLGSAEPLAGGDSVGSPLDDAVDEAAGSSTVTVVAAISPPASRDVPIRSPVKDATADRA